MVGQLAVVGQTTALTVLAGHLGPLVLGSVGVGGGVYNLALMALIGVQMAVSPSVAHRRGAGEVAGIAPVFSAALVIGLVLGCVAAALLWVAAPWLIAGVGVGGALERGSVSVARAAGLGLPALGVLLGCRGLWEGCGRTRFTLAVGVAGLVFVVPIAFVLMDGRLGVPALGAMGAGLAQALVTWIEAVLAGAFVWFSRRRLHVERWHRPRQAEVVELVALGIPMAGAVLLEVGLFTATGLLAARFGAVAASAQQVTLNLASLSFMIPLGLGIATTVRVGHAMGGRDRAAAKRAALAGMALALASQAVAASLMVFVPRTLAGFFTSDAGVIATAVLLLHLAAIFQLSDGLQVTAIGALRGLRDARVPVAITGLSYWGIGLPLAYVLAFTFGFGIGGLWVGLIVGLTASALLLSERFFRLLRQAP